MNAMRGKVAVALEKVVGYSGIHAVFSIALSMSQATTSPLDCP
jgi:hypothetical protein